MSLLVLLKNRAAGQPVIADDDDNEFLNIINCIAGVSSDKSIRVNSSDSSFAVARFNQTGVNDILELFADNSEVVRFEKTGKMVTIDPTLNVVKITKSWLYVVLPAAVETIESQPRFIVPGTGANIITRIYGVWAAGAPSGGINAFTLKRRNAAGVLQTDIGTIDTNNGGQNAVITNDITDLPLVGGDQIYPLFTIRNVGSEQMVTVSIELTVQLN